MVPKMVANFRRSLSFPNHLTNPSSSSSKSKKTFHVRSTSLPCRSHPLISQLKDGVAELRSLVNSPPTTASSAWLCDSLTRLKSVHESLDDLLQLPQTRESLSGHFRWVENILEDFLRFIDVFGIFQTMVMALKQEQSAAQMAIRRRDDSGISTFLKNLKKLSKQMGKLESTVRSVSPATTLIDGDAELAEAIKDVKEVTVLISSTLFNAISSSLGHRKSPWKGLIAGGLSKKKDQKREEAVAEIEGVGLDKLWGLKKKGEQEIKMILEKMHDLEKCLSRIESGSEGVFRSLINSRVSLLNVLIQ